MVKVVRLTHWGMKGIGANKTAARADAARNIELALTGESTPWYFHDGGHLLLVRREPYSGWWYQTLFPDSELSGYWHNCTQCAETFEETRHFGAAHLAQRAYPGTDQVPQALRELLTQKLQWSAARAAAPQSAASTERVIRKGGVTEVSFNYCDVVGVGPNKTAARKDAGRQFRAIFEGSYAPWYFRDRGHTLLLWREAFSGWSYRILHPGCTAGVLQGVALGMADFTAVRKGAINDFAQLLYTATDEIPESLQQLMSADELCQHREYCCYQTAYRTALDAGKSDQEARLAADTASGAPHTRLLGI